MMKAEIYKKMITAVQTLEVASASWYSKIAHILISERFYFTETIQNWMILREDRVIFQKYHPEINSLIVRSLRTGQLYGFLTPTKIDYNSYNLDFIAFMTTFSTPLKEPVNLA